MRHGGETALVSSVTARRQPVGYKTVMKERTQHELEQLSEKLMMTGSKVCPDCERSTLTVLFDANFLKISCSNCDFRYEDYYGG